MLSDKELRRHRELQELHSHIVDIMRVAVQTKQCADDVCKVLSAMIDSYQNWKIKQEMLDKIYWEWEDRNYFTT